MNQMKTKHESKISPNNTLPYLFKDLEDTQTEKRAPILHLRYKDERLKGISNIIPTEISENKIEKAERNSKTYAVRNFRDEFKYCHIKWSEFDSLLCSNDLRKIQEWITKKVTELIGDNDISMAKFIFDKVSGHTSPDSLASELYQVLEEETEKFVLELYHNINHEIMMAQKSKSQKLNSSSCI